jgi:replication initiation protein RepC
MIATGIEESVPTERAGQGPASWQEIHVIFRGFVDGISRTAKLEELEAAAEALSSLADDILNLLEVYVKTTDISANSLKMSATYRIQIQTP